MAQISPPPFQQPSFSKLHKDNLDVFIVFLFTNHKAGQKAECEHGTRASDTFIKEHRSRAGPALLEGDVVQQNGSYCWEQACPTRNYIHLSTEARIASNCRKAIRTEVAQL